MEQQRQQQQPIIQEGEHQSTSTNYVSQIICYYRACDILTAISVIMTPTYIYFIIYVIIALTLMGFGYCGIIAMTTRDRSRFNYVYRSSTVAPFILGGFIIYNFYLFTEFDEFEMYTKVMVVLLIFLQIADITTHIFLFRYCQKLIDSGYFSAPLITPGNAGQNVVYVPSPSTPNIPPQNFVQNPQYIVIQPAYPGQQPPNYMYQPGNMNQYQYQYAQQHPLPYQPPPQ